MAAITRDTEPYVGPQPFGVEDKDKFFGRDVEATQLQACIAAQSEVLLYAQSGAGKTSLINATLIPRLPEYEILRARVHGPELEAGLAERIRNIYAYYAITAWAEGTMTPETVASLTMAEYLAVRPARLDEEKDRCRRLLVFDQFEELFVFYPTRWRERADFFVQLRDALTREPGLSLLLAMREDRAPEIDAYAGILPERLRTRFRLERLRKQPALAAIVKPLPAPYAFAPGVADKVLKQLLTIETRMPSGEIKASEGEFVEPVQLQLVCRALWRALEPGGTTVGDRHLQRCGDVGATLRRHFDDAIAAAVKMGADEGTLRSWFAEKLITPAGTRGLVYQGETDTGGLANDIVALLDRMHVVRSEIRGTDTWYELTHDRLVAPVRESNDHFFARRHQQERETREKADPTDRANVVLDTESGTTLEHDPGTAGGTALCLSGSGYRSMLFQAGVLWRLNELGCLLTLDRCCSVSGAAITGAQLARAWSELRFAEGAKATNFEALIVAPLRQLANRNLDLSAVMKSIGLPWMRPLADSYKDHLYGTMTLGDLPDRPKFVFNTTNMLTGGIWTFSKRYMGDPLIGKQHGPGLTLADVVNACTSVPILTHFRLPLDLTHFHIPPSVLAPDEHGLIQLPLADGAFADPMALESAWAKHRTILVSDGTAWDPMTGENQRFDWGSSAARLIDILQHRTRAVRRRQITDSFRLGAREGTYWGIQADVNAFAVADALSCPPEQTIELVRLPSRFRALPAKIQERLINWGYAICDAAMRRYVMPEAPAPTGFPYPQSGV